jgi:hypothetical protein
VEKYISDITYEDKKGWISIVDKKYNCTIKRMDIRNFEIEFSVEVYEFDIIEITINTTIELL